MKKDKKQQADHKRFLKGFMFAIFLFLLVSAIYSAKAWTNPLLSPPNGNVAAPVNVGTQAQIKAGALTINGALMGNKGLNINEGGASINGGLYVYGGNITANNALIGRGGLNINEGGASINGGLVVYGGNTAVNGALNISGATAANGGLTVGGQPVCLKNGTNCPPATVPMVPVAGKYPAGYVSNLSLSYYLVVTYYGADFTRMAASIYCISGKAHLVSGWNPTWQPDGYGYDLYNGTVQCDSAM